MTFRGRDCSVVAIACVAGLLASCKLFESSRSPASGHSAGSILAGVHGLGEDTDERSRVDMEFRLTCSDRDDKLHFINSKKTQGQNDEELIYFEGLKASVAKECWLDAFGPKDKVNSQRVADCPSLEGNDKMFHYYASNKATFEEGGNALKLKIYSLCRRLLGPNDTAIRIDVVLQPGTDRQASWGTFESASASLTCDKGTYVVVAPTPLTRDPKLPFAFAVPKAAFDGQSCKALSIQVKRAGGVTEAFESVNWTAQLVPAVLQSGILPQSQVVFRPDPSDDAKYCVSAASDGRCVDRTQAAINASFPWVALVQGWGVSGAVVGPPVALVVSAQVGTNNDWQTTPIEQLTASMLDDDLARVANGEEPRYSWYPMSDRVNTWVDSMVADPTSQTDELLTGSQLASDALRSAPMRHPHQLQRVFSRDNARRWVEVK